MYLASDNIFFPPVLLSQHLSIIGLNTFLEPLLLGPICVPLEDLSSVVRTVLAKLAGGTEAPFLVLGLLRESDLTSTVFKCLHHRHSGRAYMR